MNKNIKQLIENIFDDEIFDLNDIESEIDLTHTIYKYHPETKKELKELINERIEKEGYRCDLNDIDTSYITDMSCLFYKSEFNGDINLWNVSKVTDMAHMFNKSKFDRDISLWDVSKVTDMSYMFKESKFNGDISSWDVSKVTDMSSMFYKSEFNGNISSWNINPECFMRSIYTLSKIPDKFKAHLPVHESELFNDEIFDTGSIESNVSLEDKFNLDIPTTLEDLKTIIAERIKEQGPKCDLNDIDVSKVTNMKNLFTLSEFNGDISKWDVSNVTDMSWMFQYSDFDGDISKWNVLNVRDMSHMFQSSVFDHDISSWKINPDCNTDRMFVLCRTKYENMPKEVREKMLFND